KAGSQNPEIQVAQESCNCERPDPVHTSRVELTDLNVDGYQMRARQPTPAIVVQLFCKGLGLAHPLQGAQRGRVPRGAARVCPAGGFVSGPSRDTRAAFGLSGAESPATSQNRCGPRSPPGASAGASPCGREDSTFWFSSNITAP